MEDTVKCQNCKRFRLIGFASCSTCLANIRKSKNKRSRLAILNLKKCDHVVRVLNLKTRIASCICGKVTRIHNK